MYGSLKTAGEHNMTNQKLFDMFREVFPDETVQDGQHLRKNQVGVLNAIVFELKRREINKEA